MRKDKNKKCAKACHTKNCGGRSSKACHDKMQSEE